MSHISVSKLVGICGLVAIASFLLAFAIIRQWYCRSSAVHQSQTILEIPSEILNDHTEEAEMASEIDSLIKIEREIIRNDMMGYPYPNGKYDINATKLEDMVIEENGKPVRSVILGSWRTGSTFVSSTLLQSPGNYDHFEPLSDLGLFKMRGPPFTEEALKRLRALLNCDYSDLQDTFINYGTFINPYIMASVSHVLNECRANSSICHNHRHLSALCKLSPFQSMKITRLRLEVIEELLADVKLDIRLVLLVRDPRGIVESRKHVEWCRKGPDCTETALICADLVSDYKIAVQFQSKYPDKFRSLRYEDFAADPYGQTKKLFTFFGREYLPKVEKYLDTHTKVDETGFTLYRNTKKTPYHWKTDLKFDEVEEIQRTCAAAMSHWGYVPAINATHQIQFNPVTEYVLKI